MIHERSQELITGAFVSSTDPSVNYSTQNHYIAQNNYTENHTNDMFHETYLNFNLDALSSLYSSATLTDVQLSLYGVGYNLAVREITSAWNSSTVTYATRPSLSEHVVDYFAGEQGTSSLRNLHFDITKPFAAWFNGERASYGLAITAFDPSAEAYGFMTKDASASFTRPPVLYIDFIEAAGYNNTFDYHTQDIARAGTAYINNFTRNLFLQRDDISISGNIMPVTVSFLYNSGLIQQIEQYPLDNIAPIPIYGNGWLTNYNRVLYPNAINGAVSYAAADGTIVYFTIEDGEDGSNIITEENSGALGAKGYSIDISGLPEDCETLGLEYFKLLTPKGETESFDMFGRVIKIQKTARASQSIDIHYTTNYTSAATTDFSDFLKIDYITDGVGRKYDFTYDATSGLLTSIQCYTADGTAIKAGSSEKDLKNTYTYTNGNLTKVTFPDSKTASYEYSLNRMCAAISNDIYKVNYTYMPSYSTVSPYRKIMIVNEYARKSRTDDYTSGESLAIRPDGPHQTRFFKSGSLSNFEIHQFDKFGRTTGIIDAQGNYSACSLTNESIRNETYGQIASAANAMRLVNTGFENDLTAWDADAFTNADIVSAETHSGTKALKISSEETVNKVISQSIPITVDTGFTFSAYVKAAQTNTAHMLTMKIIAFNSETNSRYENTRQIAAVDNEFERYTVQLQIPEFEEFTHIAVEIGLNGSAGTFYVDSMQLDSGLGARDYNYLTDGSLYDQTTNALSSSWTAGGA